MGRGSDDLSSADLQRALAVAGDLAGCRSVEEVDGQVRLLPRLVGADTIIIGQVQKPSPGSSEPATLVATEDPPGFFDPEARDAFARLWHEQPVVVHHFRGFAPRAMKVSDFLSDRQWRHSEVYNDCYGRRLGLAWEMAAQILCTSEAVACAALQRSSRDFNERDRTLLDAITPHMRAAYARAEADGRRAGRLRLLERDLEERGEAALLVDRRGRVSAGPRALDLLGRWFGERRAARLPSEVEAWRASERGAVKPPVLDLRRPGHRLRLRLVAGVEEDAILLAERAEGTPSAQQLRRRLPISSREAEVLALLAAGRMNAGIALDLGISEHTVRRHIENLYAKLGVHNRAAATAAAIGAAT